MNKNKYPKPALIAITKRGDTIEGLHYGWICVVNKEKTIIYKKGNIFDQTFLRSALKPIQAIPIIDNNIELTPKELAITCGSHSGSRKHLKVLDNFIKNQKLKLKDLQCGIHLPFDEDESTRLRKLGIKPSPLHNNCSGKHLGMLSVCKKNKWDLKTYLDINHPIQKAIIKNIEELSCTKNISIAIDGCGVPTFALSILDIAIMFSNFTYLSNKKYLKIISAMTKYPFYVGSKNQIDTEIMAISPERLIAKVGAEGIIIVAHNGNSAVVKIADGSPRARAIVILQLLTKLNWLQKSKIKNSILEEVLKGEFKNHAGKKVGFIKTLIDC